MISESGGRAVVTASSALGSKDHPAGPAKVPLRRIRQEIYPPRRIRWRNVEKAPWRVCRHDNLPSSPSMASTNEVWKAEGVSTFSLGVLVRGHGIHTYLYWLDVIILTALYGGGINDHALLGESGKLLLVIEHKM